MGLLDSDADELKKNAATGNSTGRRVNQSGLGALKGLSKYSSLTAKYRSTGQGTTAPVSPAVEQNRGTNPVEGAKSVQSEGKVGAKSVQSALTFGSPFTQQMGHAEVSANSVHTPQADFPSIANKVSAESVQSQGMEETVMVQSSAAADDKSVSFSGADLDSSMRLSGSEDNVESVPQTTPIAYEPAEVSAKSVQASDSVLRFSDLADDFTLDHAKSVRPAIEVSANPVQEPKGLTPSEVSANSVQSKGKVSANSPASELSKADSKVRAKPVQTQGDVRAKSVRREMQFTEQVPLNEQQSLHSKCISIGFENSSPTESILGLGGSQRTVVEFIFNLCLYSNSLITPPVTKSQLLAGTGLAEETALSSIKRLRAKYVLDRHSYKDGKAGWTQYRLAEQSYKELLHLQQLGLRTPPPVSSIERPSERPLQIQASDPALSWFKNLDFSQIQIRPMSVNPSIRTLVQQRLSPEAVQDFLNRFNSWLGTQSKVTSPLGLFCDKLKEFALEGDSPVLACLTEAERENEIAALQHAEKVRLELLMIQKAKEDQLARQNDQRLQQAFDQWYRQTPETELRQLVPGNAFAEFGTEMHTTVVRAYFAANIWRQANA